MTPLGALRHHRYHPERLFRPQSVALFGTGRLADTVLANLRQGDFPGPIHTGDDPPTADLAIIATEGQPIGPLLPRLAAKNMYAAVALGLAPDIAEASAATGVRVLGAGSFGIACPALKLNATLSHLPPQPGRVALVSQSAALCRAILDWAEPNGVGFSQIIGIGGNAGIGFAQALDFLSRDPSVGPILMDIRRVRDRRAFLSAARAAARLRPVVALRAGSRLIDPTGRAEAVFDAALARAGVLTVSRLQDLLAAMETLTRARPARGEAVAIVTNAIGPGQMAADAALAAGIELAVLAPETQAVLNMLCPGEPVGGLIYVGTEAPTRLAEAAALLAGAREVGGILVVHAPTGPADETGIAALAATPKSLHLPLLVCAMGETTGAGHRRRLAEGGIPSFASPEEAVQGFRHLVQDRHARAAARELPPSAVLTLEPDRATVRRLIDDARAGGRMRLDPAESWGVLTAYGIDDTPALPIAVADDPLFGPAIGLGRGRIADQAFDLPPLNLALARALLQRLRSDRDLHPAQQEALADMLVRTSQLVIDFPEIESLAFEDSAAMTLRAPGAASPLAIAPYPAELTETWNTLGDAHGETLTIRPIRPEDAAAHAAMFTRLTPEDVRFRFFSALRELSPERLARMTQVDYDREMAFVATRANGDTVGVSRLVSDVDGTGEFAVVVQPDMRGKGLARHLMQRLVDWGRQQGFSAIVGQVLADNAPMLGFMRALGFALHRSPDEPEVMEARLDLLVD